MKSSYRITLLIAGFIAASPFQNEASASVSTSAILNCQPIVVTSTDDNGPGTLRQAVEDICPDGTIEFASSLADQTIILTGSHITLNKNLSILNPNAPGLAISGNDNSRQFFITNGAEVTIENLKLTDGNAGAFFGGAILVRTGNLTIDRMILENNTAHAGGAFRNQDSSEAIIRNSIFRNNSTPNEGGGAINNDAGAVMTIINSSIYNNSGRFAGGIANYNGAELTVINSTVSDNSCNDAGSGGGIENFSSGNYDDSILSVINSTITENHCPGANSGGGIFNNTAEPILKNTIVAGNTGENPDLSGGFNSDGHNLIGDATGSTGFTDGVNNDQVGGSGSPIDPMLGVLQDNGGFTPTHALLPNSPAIDGGDNTDAPDTDQRGTGFPRILNGTVDIGSYEACFDNLAVLNNSNDGFGSLRERVISTCSGGTIDFDASLSGEMITLTTGHIELIKDLSILNPNAPGLAISGNDNSRIFFINSGASITMEDLTLTNGNAGSGTGIQFMGGAIRVQPGSLTLDRMILENNTARAGGALRSIGTNQITIRNSIFRNNSTPGEGGGAINNDTPGSVMTITNSSIYDNTGRFAGGIANYNGATLTVVNSTISGNSCIDPGSGGGIENFDDDSSLTIINSTITGNHCPGANSGGGLFNNTAAPVLKNTIVAGNTGEHPDLSGAYNSNGHNLIGDNTGGTGFEDGINGDIVGNSESPVDPRLHPQADNGGFTPTYALMNDSPAVNAGDPETSISIFPTDDLGNPIDQTGNPRFQSSAIDIGSVEAAGLTITLDGRQGFRFFALPADDQLSDFLSPIWTQGTTAGGNSESGDPNVWIWNNTATGNAAEGWLPVTDLTVTPQPGSGFLVYVFEDDEYQVPGSWPKTLSVGGSLYSLPVSPDINSHPSGFTLVGNPTVSTIAWDGINRTDIDDAVYVWDPNLSAEGDYRSWSGGAGDIADGHIYPFQSFFVRTSEEAVEPSLEISQTSVPGDFYGRGADPYVVRLQLEGEGLTSSAWLRFSDGGSAGPVSGDVLKLQPLASQLALLASQVEEKSLLDIKHLPLEPANPISIPLIAEATRSGIFTLSATRMHLPANRDWSLSISDQLTGETHTLDEDFEIQFSIDSGDLSNKKISGDSFIPESFIKVGDASPRFTLNIEPEGSPGQELPDEFALSQNYPNPFNPTTQIEFSVPESGNVTLEVFNVTGQRVAVLAEGMHSAGHYSLIFDGSQLASGIYLYRLRSRSFSETRKMLLMK